MQEPQANVNIYDLKLWKKFWEISRMYWFSDEKWKARGTLDVNNFCPNGYLAVWALLQQRNPWNGESNVAKVIRLAQPATYI